MPVSNIESGFLDLMPQTLQLQRLAGRDNYGEPVFGVVEDIRCRVVSRFVLERDADGQERRRKATTAWTFGAHGIKEQDRIVLPDGTSPPILLVNRYPDETGLHHEKVEF